MSTNDWDINEDAIERLREQLPPDTVRDGRPWQHSYPDLELLTHRLPSVSPPPDSSSVDLAEGSLENWKKEDDNLNDRHANPLSVEEIDPEALRVESEELTEALEWLDLEGVGENSVESGEASGELGEAPMPGGEEVPGAGTSPQATLGAPSEEESLDALLAELGSLGAHDTENDFQDAKEPTVEIENIDAPDWLARVHGGEVEGSVPEDEEWLSLELAPERDVEPTEDGEGSATEPPGVSHQQGGGGPGTEDVDVEPPSVSGSAGEEANFNEKDSDSVFEFPEAPASEGLHFDASDEGELISAGSEYDVEAASSDLAFGTELEGGNRETLDLEGAEATRAESAPTAVGEHGRAIDELLAAFEEQFRGDDEDEGEIEAADRREGQYLDETSPVEPRETAEDTSSEKDVDEGDTAGQGLEADEQGPLEIGLEEVAQRFQSVWAEEEAKNAEGEGVELVVERRFGRPTLLNRLGFQEISRRLGLEIGSSEITFVCLAKRGRSYEVEAYGIVPFREIGQTGEVPETLLTATLHDLLSEGELRQADVFVASQMIDAAVRTLELPKLSTKELASAVRWAVRKEVPFDIESASLVYRVQEGLEGKKQRVLAVATDSGQLTRLTDTLRKAGSLPSGVYPAGIALYDLFRRSKLFDPNACHVLVHIGTLTSQILLIENGRLAFERNVSTALDDFLTALTNSLFYDGQNVSLSQREAYWILRRYGVLEPGSDDLTEGGIPLNEIAVSVRPVLEKLANEISRSLDYFRQRFGTDRFEHVWVSGIGATVLNLCNMLEAETRVPTSRFDPFSEDVGLPVHCSLEKIQEYGPALAVPLSLALGVDGEFNLLPRNLRRSRALRWAQKAAAYGGLIGFLLMATLSLQARLNLRIEENELAVLKDRYEVLQKNQQQLRLLRQQQLSLEKTLAELREALPGEPTIPLYMHALSKLTPAKIAITSLEIVDREKALEQMRIQVGDDASAVMRIRGIVFPDPPNEGAHLANFVLALKTSGLFRNVRVEENQPSDLPRVGAEFSIIGELP